MGAFSVSVPAVDALSFRVLTAASDVRSAQGKLASQACVDTGYPELSGALSEFQTFWQTYTDGVGTAIEGTGASISAAAAAYQTVDSTVIADPALTSASSAFSSAPESAASGANVPASPALWAIDVPRSQTTWTVGPWRSRATDGRAE